MNTILWIILAAASVPDVTAGPDLAEQAVLVEAPIDEVTVFSDRARIRRTARHGLEAGSQTLRLPDLPGSVLMDTVRVGCDKARVLRVEAVPIERERYSIEQVEELIDRLEALTDKLAAAAARRQIHQLELGFLAGIAPRAPVVESERVGKPMPAVEPDMWKRVLDFLQKRRDHVRARVRDLDEQRRKLSEELTKVQREVGRHDLGAFTDRKVQMLAIVQADRATSAVLTLEYFVPGASWRPIYDLTYLSDKARVNLRTAGMVHQATGEDWTDVRLLLSTAIPGQGIDLPELLTWALGEKKEFIPKARAARMPAVPPRFGPPVASKTPYEAKREAKLQVLRRRISSLQGLLVVDASRSIATATLGGLAGKSEVTYKKKTVYDFEDDSISGELARPDAAYLEAKRVRRRPSRLRGKRANAKAPPSPPMAAPAEAEPVLLAEESRSTGRRRSHKPTERVRTTSLGLFEPTFYTGPRFTDPNLPAVAAGGLDYVYTCPTRMSIPSSGERIAVPLSVDSFPATVFYEATPALKEVAYLKAEVQNKGKRPILAGTVNIFMGPDFAGQGRLETTGPGGKLPLPLGADENIRLKRTIVPKTETEGVFSKDDITTYTVTIEVGNYKKRRVKIAVFDQVPRSGNEDIEIEKGKLSPRPVKGPDLDGIMRWELDIPAGKTQKIEFRYKIERPENWQLHQ